MIALWNRTTLGILKPTPPYGVSDFLCYHYTRRKLKLDWVLILVKETQCGLWRTALKCLNPTPNSHLHLYGWRLNRQTCSQLNTWPVCLQYATLPRPHVALTTRLLTTIPTGITIPRYLAPLHVSKSQPSFIY